MPTVEECKRMISKLGFELGVSPRLITTRLLDAKDKKDLVCGLLPVESLREGVKLWLKNEMPDYAHGQTQPYRPYASDWREKA